VSALYADRPGIFVPVIGWLAGVRFAFLKRAIDVEIVLEHAMLL
jgi:hypothetical protein